MRSFTKNTLSAAVSSLLFLPLTSFASAEVDQPEEQLALEKIMVTAQKRGENLQEVPLAVSVLNAKDMDRGNIQTFQDIQHAVPNLSMMVFSPFSTTVNMRGIPSNPNGVFNSGTSPGLGIYVDGVVYARPTGFNQELSNISRVEVLRGPQGTLFGQNTNLGVVNITTRKPSDMFESKIKVDVGNYNLRKTNAYLSGPIIEEVVAASISLFDVKRDGYIDNLNDNTDMYTEDRHGGRTQWRITPSDDLTLDINAEFLKDNSIPVPRNLTDYQPGLGFIGLLNQGKMPEEYIYNDIRTVSVNSEHFFSTRDNWGLDATLSYTFNSGFEFKSITARKTYDSILGNDSDSTPLAISYSIESENNRQFTQEFQLLSPPDRKLRYVAGFYYLDNDAINLQRFSSGTGIFGVPTGLPAPYPQSLNLMPESGVVLNGSLNTESSAVFANINYDFTDSINGFADLRYSEVEKNMSFQQQGWSTSLPGVYLLNYIDIPETRQQQKDDFVSWTFGLSGKLNKNTNLYGKVSKGYKEGGYSFRPQSLQAINGDPSNPHMDFAREEVLSYEAGLKSDLMERRLRLNLALFYLDYADIQTRVVDDAGVNRVINGPSASSQGIEAEINYRLNQKLTLNMAFGYADATFDAFADCHTTDDCTNNQLPGAAKWTNNLSLKYETELTQSWDMFAGIDYSYRSKIQSDARNLKETELDSSNLINAQVGFVSEDGSWEIMLWSKNLLDEESLVFSADKGSSDLSFSNTIYAPPRTFGVSVTYSYF